MDRKSFYRTLSPIGTATAQPQLENYVKWGKGTTDHMMPLGDWFGLNSLPVNSVVFLIFLAVLVIFASLAVLAIFAISIRIYPFPTIGGPIRAPERPHIHPRNSCFPSILHQKAVSHSCFKQKSLNIFAHCKRFICMYFDKRNAP